MNSGRDLDKYTRNNHKTIHMIDSNENFNDHTMTQEDVFFNKPQDLV